MMEWNDLFDSREIVGCRLEQMIQKRGYTKKDVCAGAGISRPTLDKILDGAITNKTNFEKHTAKLLAYLSLSPQELMSGMENPFTDMKNLRKALSVDLSRLSEISGVSVEKLKKLEAGENIPLEDLRDVAACLGTSVMGILGNGYFQTQVARLDGLIKEDAITVQSPGGFWGHLGILLCGQSKYRWFPITNFTRQMIYQSWKQKYMAIPCMNNALLLINCGMIEELVLLDEACDQPADMDWDVNVSCGEVPNVIYEAFWDYLLYKEDPKDPKRYGLSSKFVKMLDRFVADNGIDAEKFNAELNTATVIFANGRVQKHNLEIGCSEELDTAVCQIYESGEIFGDEMIAIGTGNEEVFVNFKNVSMINLPLAKIENDIYTMLG